MDNGFNNEKYTFKQPYLENIQIVCIKSVISRRFCCALLLCDEKQESVFEVSII